MALRIISQDGKASLPFDLCKIEMAAVNPGQPGGGKYEIRAYMAGVKYFTTMGIYAAEEEAKAVMADLLDNWYDSDGRADWYSFPKDKK